MLSCILLVLSALHLATDAASILGFFPFPGKSHHKMFAPLMKELAIRGHDVYYYTPIPAPEGHPRLRQVLLKDFGPLVLGTLNFTELGELDMASHMNMVYNKTYTLLDLVFQEEDVKKLLHSKRKFNAVMLESYFFQEANSALIHKFDAVGIDIVPLGDHVWVNEITGFKTHYSYMNDYKTYLTDEMSFWERLYNTYVMWSLISTCYWNLERMQGLMDLRLTYDGWENRPSLSKLVSNRSLVLVNKDPFIGFPYPHAPHIKEVGGLSVLKTKPLPEDLQNFMDRSKYGVIYMSLGLNMHVSEVLKEKLQYFIHVFENMKQNVLLKWEEDMTLNMPPNVKTSREFPQQDILAHPNCVLFVTHGGYFSLLEAVHHGIPMVGIPFYGDQPRNMLWAKRAGVGVYLDRRNLSETSIRWALNEVLSNNKYKEQIGKRSQMVRSRMQSPMEEAIYWIEHAIKYPNTLTPKSAYQSFLVFHQVDVEVFLLSLLAIGLLAVYVLSYSVWIYINRRKCIKIKKQ